MIGDSRRGGDDMVDVIAGLLNPDRERRREAAALEPSLDTELDPSVDTELDPSVDAELTSEHVTVARPSGTTATVSPASMYSCWRGITTNPSARLKAVTDPEPFPIG